MKRIGVAMMIGCFGITAFAGDTNFVAQYDAIWKTHNASNILAFVERNVATNRSAEVLFARGNIALTLQDWCVGATNYWEQSIQIISTNSTYAEIGRTNVINKIRWLQGLFTEIEQIDPAGFNAPPSWNPVSQAVDFSTPKAPYLSILEEIVNLPPAKK